MEKPQNVLIKDVELNWAKLDRPVNPFGTEQYEVQIAVDTAERAEELRKLSLNVKEKDGKFTVSLKRKAKRANGEDNGAPRVVDANKQAMSASGIGNGSRGNVIIWQAPYEVMGRSGITQSLTAVQVTSLVEYTGGAGSVDFDIEGDVEAKDENQADLF